MPEKKAVPTFDAIMRDLKDGHYAPIYLLMGDESYYIDKISDYIQQHVLKPEQQAFDQTVVFGADVNGSMIADLAMQYPMMSPQKVIIVKEAQAMRSYDKLEKYALKPQPRTILVLCYKNGTMDKRLKFYNAVTKNGLVFESKKLKEWQLPDHIRNYLKSQNVGIDDKSCAMIAENIGADLNRLMSELNKLIISLPDNDRRVTPDMVEKNIGVSKDFNVFELRDAIVNRNVVKANRIIKYFDENKKAGSLFSYLPMLFNYFQNLMLAYYAPNKNNQQALADYLELRSVWGVKDYMAGLRNYTGRKTLQILQKLREIDAKSKGINNPSTSEGELAKELVFFILH
jgi:DNA polymerase-3 subunit delta